MAPCHAMARGVGHRRSVEAKSGAGAERVAVQSWSCDGDGARGDSAHGGDGARSIMSGETAAAAVAVEGLVQDRRANRTGRVEASEVVGHVVVVAAAVAVGLYNASVAAVVAAAAAGVVAVAAACATCIPSPAGARFPLCHVHPARKRDRHDVRGLSLASSH